MQHPTKKQIELKRQPSQPRQKSAATHRYVVMDLAAGESWCLSGDENSPLKKTPFRRERRALPDLLSQGWRPVREIPANDGDRGYCVVLLTRRANV